MSAVLAFLRIAYPWLIGAGIGFWSGTEIGSIRVAHVQTQLSSYKAQVADADDKAQKAAADALQAQIDTRLTTEARNGQIVSQLTAERDSAAADRDFARRLLAATKAGPTPTSSGVPEASHQPGTPAAGPASGNGSLVELVGAAVDECRANTRQLNALIEEIQPQL